MSKNIFLLVVLLIALTGGHSLSVFAQDERQPAFFTFLNDVPLMSGLTELPDETVAFDKPGGRIIESTAYAEKSGPTAEDIETFYSQTLPHLGWRQVDSGTFWRQDEVLQFEIEEHPAGKQVFVTVMPAR